MGKIAKAAWCADPGIQYDGTINDWHTNPETGRITASNPCSGTCRSTTPRATWPRSTCSSSSGRRHLRRGAVREGRRARHHGDGHLDLLRRLPDRADRRHHARLPPTRHRLRQPRRAAHGHRPRVRLRGWPRHRRVDHLAAHRCRLQALRRDGRGRRAVCRVRPQRRRPQAGHAQARRRQRRDPHHRHDGQGHPPRSPPRRGMPSSRLGEKNGYRNAQASVLAPPGPSAS